MFFKLAWILAAFILISGGRTIVEWMGLNVIGFSPETADSFAAGYVVVIVLVIIPTVVWLRFRR
ncbi:MAG TPA: hypothetical protein VJT71_06055 [Pyrinomonadaceae bacterium]|nr:hypothetical protein [Pyrinomonadaceae bacterium]